MTGDEELRGLPSDAIVKLVVREMERAIEAIAVLECVRLDPIYKPKTKVKTKVKTK